MRKTRTGGGGHGTETESHDEDGEHAQSVLEGHDWKVISESLRVSGLFEWRVG